jgi:nicotinamidase-related amidase
VKPRGSACHVLFFSDGDEVSQVAEFHSPSSISVWHGEPRDKVFPFARSFGQSDSRYNKTAVNQKNKTNGTNMKSTPIRDPKKDIMLAPGNAALILIDYQPPQVSTVESIDRRTLITNIVALAKTAKLNDLPVILSTVNVSNGVNEDTIPELREVLKGVKPIDRSSINSWEDQDFVDAVKAAGCKKLIMCALWTEACLLFPALDALNEGYEVYPVTDAVGGTSQEAHRAALECMVQAGTRPTTWNSVHCELQRDWNRTKTVPGFVKTFVEHGNAGWFFNLAEHRAKK